MKRYRTFPVPFNCVPKNLIEKVECGYILYRYERIIIEPPVVDAHAHTEPTLDLEKEKQRTHFLAVIWIGSSFLSPRQLTQRE